MSSKRNVIDLRKRRPPRVESSVPLPFYGGGGGRKRRPLRIRRRRTRVAITGGIFVALISVLGGICYVSYLPRFNIQSIVVTGAVHTSPQEIKGYANSLIHSGSRSLLSRSNIFLYHPERIAAAIPPQFPRIKSATVNRPSLFATDVHIAVMERQSFALWCTPADASSTDCYDMDESGFIFASADASSTLPTTYVFSGGIDTGTPLAATFASGHLQGLLAFLQFLSLDGFAPQGAHIESGEDFTVSLAAGFYIKASFGENAEDLAKNLQLILSSDPLQGKLSRLEYIDLRFGDRVYYKLKGESNQGTR